MQKARPNRRRKGGQLVNVPWKNPWHEYEWLKKSLSKNSDKYLAEAIQLTNSLKL